MLPAGGGASGGGRRDAGGGGRLEGSKGLHGEVRCLRVVLVRRRTKEMRRREGKQRRIEVS